MFASTAGCVFHASFAFAQAFRAVVTGSHWRRGSKGSIFYNGAAGGHGRTYLHGTGEWLLISLRLAVDQLRSRGISILRPGKKLTRERTFLGQCKPPGEPAVLTGAGGLRT